MAPSHVPYWLLVPPWKLIIPLSMFLLVFLLPSPYQNSHSSSATVLKVISGKKNTFKIFHIPTANQFQKQQHFWVYFKQALVIRMYFLYYFLIVRTEIQRRVWFGLTLRVQSMAVQTQEWEELDKLALPIIPTLKQNYMLSAHGFCLIPFGSQAVE